MLLLTVAFPLDAQSLVLIIGHWQNEVFRTRVVELWLRLDIWHLHPHLGLLEALRLLVNRII